MWIKFLKQQIIEVDGMAKTFYPGDWFDVGKQTGNRWIMEGIAVKPNYDVNKDYIDVSAGILALKSISDHTLKQFKKILMDVPIIHSKTGLPELPYPETMIFTPGVKPHYDLYPMAFKNLKKWQVIVPMYSYTELACHIGDENDQAMTKEVIRDLRVPTYDTRLVFVARCSQTEDFVNCWNEEKQKASNDNLAFHRAFYKIKPIMLVLPTSWVS